LQSGLPLTLAYVELDLQNGEVIQEHLGLLSIQKCIFINEIMLIDPITGMNVIDVVLLCVL
jgi:hypothetical protein